MSKNSADRKIAAVESEAEEEPPIKIYRFSLEVSSRNIKYTDLETHCDMDLIACIHKGEEASARSLIEQATVDVNVPGSDGITPLMQAVMCGSSTELVQALLSAGARTDFISHTTGWTPLMYAAHYSRSHIVQLLVARDDIEATVNIKSPIDDFTALMLAAKRGKHDVVWMLVEAGADLDAANIEQETALMIAGRAGHADVVRLLLQKKKAAIDAKNQKNETVTMIAKAHLQGEIYLICMDHGANVIDTYLTPAEISLFDIQEAAFREGKQVVEYILFANRFDRCQKNIVRRNTGEFHSDITNLILQKIGSRKQITYNKQALDALPMEVADLINRSDSVRILISSNNSSCCSIHLTEQFRLKNCKSLNKYGRPIEHLKCPCKSDMTAVFELSDDLESLIPQTSAKCITPVSSNISAGNGNSATVTIRSEYYMLYQIVSLQIKNSCGNIDSKCMFVLFLNQHYRPAMDSAGSLRAAFTSLIRRFEAFADIICSYAENVHDNEFIAKSILEANYKIIANPIQPRSSLVRPLETLINNGLDFKLTHFTGNTLLETLASWNELSESIGPLLNILIKEYGVKVHTRNVQQKNIYQTMLKKRTKYQRHIAEILEPYVIEADIRKLDPLVPEDLNYCPTCMIEAERFNLTLNSDCEELARVKQRIDSLTDTSTATTSEYDSFINCLMNLLSENTKNDRLCGHGYYGICAAVARFWRQSNGEILVDGRGRNPLHMHAFINNRYLTQELTTEYPRQVKGLLDNVHKCLEMPLLIAKPDQLERTPLHYFVQRDSDRLFLETLLSNMTEDTLRTSINMQDRFGRTVLHYAALICEGNGPIDLLMQKGANESILDDFGRSTKDCKDQVLFISERSLDYTRKIKDLNSDVRERRKFIGQLGSKTHLIVLDLSTLLPPLGSHAFEYKSAARIFPFAYQDNLCTIIHEELCQFMERLFDKLYDQDKRFKSKVVSVGSGYEKSRIGLVDEFDFNIVLIQFSKICETYLTPACPPGFVHVRKSSRIDVDETYAKFFDGSGVLKTKELKNTFEKLVKNMLKNKCAWENELFFEMSIVHEELLNTYETNKCSFKIKLTVLNPAYTTIFIDIVPVLHTDGYWPRGTLQETSQEFKNNRCNLVFDQPHNIHPWLPKHIPYARISFAPAESEIVHSCPMESRVAFMLSKYLNEAFIDLKQDLPFRVTSHILKTMLLYCLAAEARSTKRKTVRKPVEWRNNENEFNDQEVTIWLEKLLNCFLCFHRLDYLPSFFLPSLCRPISEYERYIRENITQLAIRCLSANIKRDILIKHTIETEINRPRSMSYPPQPQPPSRTSKLYIYKSFSSAVYNMIHVVGEEYDGWLRLHQLTDQENCLIEHFNTAAFYSHMNGGHGMKWFRELDESEEVPAAKRISSLHSTPPPPCRPVVYISSKPQQSVGLHNEMEQLLRHLRGTQGPSGSGQSERSRANFWEPNNPWRQQFPSEPKNFNRRSNRTNKYNRGRQAFDEFPQFNIPSNFMRQGVPVELGNIIRFNTPNSQTPQGISADLGQYVGNFTATNGPTRQHAPSAQDQYTRLFAQAHTAYRQHASAEFREFRSQFNIPNHSASEQLTPDEIEQYEKQFEMMDNPR